MTGEVDSGTPTSAPTGRQLVPETRIKVRSSLHEDLVPTLYDTGRRAVIYDCRLFDKPRSGVGGFLGKSPLVLWPDDSRFVWNDVSTWAR